MEFYISAVICLVTGTMFLMWLGEQITERGIGNGISLIITAGIAAGIPTGFIQLWNMVSQRPYITLSIVIGTLFLIYIVVFFEAAQRKIPIHYAKKQLGAINHS